MELTAMGTITLFIYELQLRKDEWLNARWCN
jgi:hypothetical protein